MHADTGSRAYDCFTPITNLAPRTGSAETLDYFAGKRAAMNRATSVAAGGSMLASTTTT